MSTVRLRVIFDTADTSPTDGKFTTAAVAARYPRPRSGAMLRKAHEQARLALRVLQDGAARAVSLA